METTRGIKSYVTQTVSLYLTAAELASRGFVVATTTRNAPGVDLMATSSDMGKTYGIQVKGNHWTGVKTFWLVGKRAKKDVAPRLFYVFVNLKPPGERPEFYVVPSRIVAKHLWVGRGSSRGWYSFQREKRYLENWSLLH